jgi:hypothetical protein
LRKVRENRKTQDAHLFSFSLNQITATLASDPETRCTSKGWQNSLFLFPSIFRCLFKAAVSPLLYLADFGWQAIPSIFTYFLPKPQTSPASSPTPPPQGVAGKAREMTKERTIRKSAKDY